MEFIETPPQKYNITRESGGKGSKMSKSEAPAKVYSKSRSEHIKDMLIVALIVGIGAFVGGMEFRRGQDAEIERAVAASQTATVEPVKK